MKERIEIDISGVEIKKCPPGKAYGATDLQKWSHNRMRGLSGSWDDKTKLIDLKCKKCKSVITITVPWKFINSERRRCRQCGKLNFMKITKPHGDHPK